jgi:NADH:ubiquinone oxidoreductase subunit 5 (subunit L)/multisubunit Na+/H+ antiporter MnhA subunit
MRAKRPELARFLEQAWSIDRAFHERLVVPLKLGAFLLASLVDQFALDGLVNGAGTLATSLGTRLRSLADGQVKHYALWMGAGAAGLSLLWIWIA